MIKNVFLRQLSAVKMNRTFLLNNKQINKQNNVNNETSSINSNCKVLRYVV